jgi:hypothetical protein
MTVAHNDLAEDKCRAEFPGAPFAFDTHLLPPPTMVHENW